MRREVYCMGLAPTPVALVVPRSLGGCSDRGCFLMVSGRALIGRWSEVVANVQGELLSDVCGDGSDIGGLLMTLTTVGTDDVDDTLCSVSEGLCLLAGLGGRAGRSLSDSADETIGVEMILVGATMWTLGLWATTLGARVIVVGATLLIGFRGGTVRFPEGI